MRKPPPSPAGCGTKLSSVVLAALVLGPVVGQAQLAITEAMSSTSTTLGEQTVSEGSDYWELTNFGTETVELTGYSWNDNKGERNTAPFIGVRIAPGESVVFFQIDETPTTAGFRAWWGLDETVQVIPWGVQPGLGSSLDLIDLWDPSGAKVDHVSFGQSQRGTSFTYDPETGMFGALSVLGAGGAAKAVTADDIGSPGRTAGPVKPSIAAPPADFETDQGQEATFAVRAVGVPPPRYQWWHGQDLIPGATDSTLFFAAVHPAAAGTYRVVIDNGIGPALTAEATLVVSTHPRAPEVVQPLVDAEVYDGQTARFAVRARGFPALDYRWQCHGADVPGATGPRLEVEHASLAQSGDPYTVEIRNALGVTTSSARLRVHPKPRLLITEVMSAPSTNTLLVTRDWFELTNLDTSTVALDGWKFSDRTQALLEGVPATIPAGTRIEPGESIVFVERMSAADFVAWWGPSNLPPRLTVLPFAGFGLDSGGDTLSFWNASATDPWDRVTGAVFALAAAGFSMNFAPDEWRAVDSVEGVEGAFRAAKTDDVGSPGYSIWAQPRFLEVQVEADRISLTWQSVKDRRYELQRRTQLGPDGEWIRLGEYQADGRSLQVTNPRPIGEGPCFYRLECLPEGTTHGE